MTLGLTNVFGGFLLITGIAPLVETALAGDVVVAVAVAVAVVHLIRSTMKHRHIKVANMKMIRAPVVVSKNDSSSFSSFPSSCEFDALGSETDSSGIMLGSKVQTPSALE